MTVETGTTISELDETWPLGTDAVLEGDDHIRLLKAILKAQFAGKNGNGFEKAITATEDEINYLSGVTSNIQDQIDAITDSDVLTAPQGTVLIFNSVIPVGWTALPFDGNSRLLAISGTPNGGGGVDSFNGFSLSHSHSTNDHALTQNEIPSHRHTLIGEGVPGFYIGGSSVFKNSGGQSVVVNSDTSIPETWNTMTADTGSDQAHNHGNTDSSNVSWFPRYYTSVMASKD